MPIVAALIAALITLHTQTAPSPTYCKHGVHIHLIWGEKPCVGEHNGK
jgi:hypothetical protein